MKGEKSTPHAWCIEIWSTRATSRIQKGRRRHAPKSRRTIAWLPTRGIDDTRERERESGRHRRCLVRPAHFIIIPRWRSLQSEGRKGIGAVCIHDDDDDDDDDDDVGEEEVGLMYPDRRLERRWLGLKLKFLTFRRVFVPP